MQATYIPYTKLSIFSKLMMEYLSEAPNLKEFYAYPAHTDGFKEKLAQYQFKGNRKVLADAFEKQYQQIPIHPKVKENIQLLLKENTYTITTGHQLNIFTGPLFFIYKIAATIKLCQDLKTQFPDKNFVPIYWMATEDHDFEEINHTYLEDKKIIWNIASAGATGKIPTLSIQDTLKEYEDFLGLDVFGKELSILVRNAYTNGDTLAQATRNLSNALFEHYGLLILDADQKELKALFSEIIFDDIVQQLSYKKISESNQKLENLGYPIQVQPREINFFYLDENLRERIVFEKDQYKVLNTTIQFSEESLREEIRCHPEKFSPNVVMRPVYQEFILPNLAYIGGAGEMAYWLQLKNNFDGFQIDFPILILRNSALVFDKITAKNYQKIALPLEDLFLPLHELQKKWVVQNSSKNLYLNKEKEVLSKLINDIQSQANDIDVTLHCSAAALQFKMNKLLDQFEKKMLRAEKRNFEDSIRQLSKLKNHLFPNGSLQERKLNIASIYKKQGKTFIDEIILNFHPLAQEFTLLFPDE